MIKSLFEKLQSHFAKTAKTWKYTVKVEDEGEDFIIWRGSRDKSQADHRFFSPDDGFAFQFAKDGGCLTQ